MNGAKFAPWLLLSATFFLLFFSSKTQLCTAADTISSGQSLYPNQTLISQAGNFELGFFTPGKSLNYYIGIWYKKISVRTYVWVANREQPITDLSSAQLKLLENGNLVLLGRSKTPIWSTNSASNGLNSIKAVLGDDGNFILQDGSNASGPIWESFDHPADTWLPGGKLTYDNITKKPQKLISWKNLEDPAPGLFALELAPDSEYIIKWNGSRQYWTSGTWDGNIFSKVPEMRLSYIYNFSFIANQNESFFTYNVKDTSLFTRFVTDLSGQIKMLTWLTETREWNLFWSQPRQQCEVHAICGAFGVCNEKALPPCRCLNVGGFEPGNPKDWNLSDSSSGCRRKIPLKCGNKYKFLLMPSMKLPINSVSLAVNSAGNCEQECLNNCSCNAYAYTSTGCLIWHDDMLNAQQLDSGSGENLYIKVDPSEVSSGKKGSTRWAIIGAVAGITALLGLVLVLIWRWRVRRSFGKSTTTEGSLVAFTYKDLQIATKNFSEKLGGGGFGSVFKGTLSDSSIIAVKKLEGISQGEKQFRSEVSTIGTIQHVNLVRLRGFCSEGTKRLLVYDFMPNSSLDSHLFHQNKSKNLDWKARYNIALGTARGLAYLHEKCRDCIIHCDIKPENILLDADFCPKVADFGLAKLVGREFSRVLTTMRGTRGYLAPEWISGVAITAKADVYSYGMMLFEIISGRRNSEQSEGGKIGFFPTWAASKVAEGEEVITILDNELDGTADLKELTRAFRVACWCIQDDEFHRPSMGQVVQILDGVLEVNPPPIPRSLQVLVESDENIHFFSESSNRSSKTQSKSSSASSQSKSGTSTDSFKS